MDTPFDLDFIFAELPREALYLVNSMGWEQALPPAL